MLQPVIKTVYIMRLYYEHCRNLSP